MLWDCIATLDAATINMIKGLGGLKAIAISHPHFYTTMVEWARAFGCPIHLNSADSDWIMHTSTPSEPIEAPAEASGPPTVSPPPAATTDRTADATERYLRDVEYALMSGKYWGSPDALAQTLISEMTTGQTGGLTTLRESNAAVLARLEAISPPAGCEAHHRETVATVAASVEMLAAWESMLQQGDLAGFASITGDAEALKARAERVEAMTEALRSGR